MRHLGIWQSAVFLLNSRLGLLTAAPAAPVEVPTVSVIRCAAGREVYFKGHEKELFKVADSIFASGYLTEGGQSLEATFRQIENAGFTWAVESKDE